LGFLAGWVDPGEIHIEKLPFDPDYQAIARPRKFLSHVR
jgi:hypothetical protein